MDDKWMYHGRRDTTNLRSYFHLPQLQWLGLDYTKHKSNITAIKQYIEWIAEKIDFPILHDQYDASLILLRHRFCWSYTDIFYSAKNVQNSKDERLTAAAQNKLLSAEVNLGEFLLYKRLNQTWWAQSEVKYFSALNLRVSTVYTLEVKRHVPVSIPESRWHHKFDFTMELCKYILMEEHQIHERMIRCTKGYLR